MVHRMHTLLQTAFGCFSSLQAAYDVLATTSHILIEAHHALLQIAFKQCDLPTSLLQSAGPDDVTAVTHLAGCKYGCSDSYTACINMHRCKLHAMAVKY